MTDDPAGGVDGTARSAHVPPGDPVCWLHLLCPECGAVPTADGSARCWRCGAATAEAGVDAT